MLKRTFDLSVSFISMVVLTPLFVVLLALAALETGSSGLFVQIRIGRYGKPFQIYKLRTMHVSSGKIGPVSLFFRRTKLDELPQLFNVLIGDMSFVGPRPDLPGYYDKLEGDNRKLLELRPGITSQASIAFRKEEELLSGQSDPQRYNDEVIFPKKIAMNMEYYHNRSFLVDLKLILKTIFS